MVLVEGLEGREGWGVGVAVLVVGGFGEEVVVALVQEVEEGLVEGVVEVLVEGVEEGLVEGMEEGLVEGVEEGLEAEVGFKEGEGMGIEGIVQKHRNTIFVVCQRWRGKC